MNKIKNKNKFFVAFLNTFISLFIIIKYFIILHSSPYKKTEIHKDPVVIVLFTILFLLLSYNFLLYYSFKKISEYEKVRLFIFLFFFNLIIAYFLHLYFVFVLR